MTAASHLIPRVPRFECCICLAIATQRVVFDSPSSGEDATYCERHAAVALNERGAVAVHEIDVATVGKSLHLVDVAPARDDPE